MTWTEISPGCYALKEGDKVLVRVMRNYLALGWPWSVYATDRNHPISEPMPFDDARRWAERWLATRNP